MNLRPLFDVRQSMERGALALSPRGLPTIYRFSGVLCVSGWYIRWFWRVLRFVTDRLQSASLEKFHRMSCPLYLLGVKIKQR